MEAGRNLKASLHPHAGPHITVAQNYYLHSSMTFRVSFEMDCSGVCDRNAGLHIEGGVTHSRFRPQYNGSLSPNGIGGLDSCS